MMMNMFSNFDVYSINWKIPIMWTLSSIVMIKINMNLFTSTINLMQMTTTMMTSNSKSMTKTMKMNLLMLYTLMMIILSINFTNTIPLMMSLSSNLMFTLSITLMMWTCNLVFISLNNYNILFMNLTPKNTPTYLTIIINLIELNSFMFQIISLSMRLMINMIMGHIIIMMMNNFKMITMYLLMETFIIMIQSYVFYTLNMLNFNNSN